MAQFVDVIAARNLTLADAADWTTPAAVDLPNGDPCTQPITSDAGARFAETANDFAIPWGSSGWSVEMWTRYTGTPPGVGAPVVARMNSAETVPEWTLGQSGASTPEMFFTILTSTAGAIVSVFQAALSSGVWLHTVLTLNSGLGSGAVAGRRVLSYTNATLDTTTTIPSTSFTPATTLTSGKLLLGSAAFSPTFMEIGKVAIYHRELTSGEISDHYDAMTT